MLDSRFGSSKYCLSAFCNRTLFDNIPANNVAHCQIPTVQQDSGQAHLQCSRFHQQLAGQDQEDHVPTCGQLVHPLAENGWSHFLVVDSAVQAVIVMSIVVGVQALYSLTYCSQNNSPSHFDLAWCILMKPGKLGGQV